MNNKLISLINLFEKRASIISQSKDNAKVRNRGDVVFPAESSKVKDNKDHFPINDADQARSALSYANHYSSAPDWYDGSLQSLVSAVRSAVKKKYPSIDLSEKSKNPGKG